MGRALCEAVHAEEGLAESEPSVREEQAQAYWTACQGWDDWWWTG